MHFAGILPVLFWNDFLYHARKRKAKQVVYRWVAEVPEAWVLFFSDHSSFGQFKCLVVGLGKFASGGMAFVVGFKVVGHGVSKRAPKFDICFCLHVLRQSSEPLDQRLQRDFFHESGPTGI